ncbi:hypothetical protein HOD83_02745 [Candidatus Woesearchaeota archaeon]|jgi:hypothetical protein|nr:hypothetical protein [Candidatus Woesearchaeota archaeon]MBT4114604.1 hypothetical protein [Candidatus Woesearchaeota archaeon]MBT4248485.1 hypothetical protein [Candidatus Woesearchaeota archaeon]
MVKTHSGPHKNKKRGTPPKKLQLPLFRIPLPLEPQSVILTGECVDDNLIHAVRHSTLVGNTYVPAHLYESDDGEKLIVVPACDLSEKQSVDLQTYHTRIAFPDFGKELAIVDPEQKRRRKIGRSAESPTSLGLIVTSDSPVVIGEHKKFHLVD